MFCLCKAKGAEQVLCGRDHGSVDLPVDAVVTLWYGICLERKRSGV